MFGCCVAGRLLQTNLQQIDETKAAFELPAAETINHVCVFLLGSGEQPSFLCVVHQYQPWVQVPFPDGYGATVHFFWPGKGFQLLGMSVFTQFFTFAIYPQHDQHTGCRTKSPQPSFVCVGILCRNPLPLKRHSRTRRNLPLAQA